MIANIALELQWEPAVIDRLFLDDADHHGLHWWHEKVAELHKSGT